MPKKLHDCVNKVKGKPGVDDPWAVCNAALNHKSKQSRPSKAKKPK